MPLEPDFVADCPYGPGGLLIDEILTIERENHFVRCRMPTYEELPSRASSGLTPFATRATCPAGSWST